MTKIQNANLYEILPFNVRNDDIEIQSLAFALQKGISKICQYADRVKVMSNIDNITEDVINNIATELNIPCFDVNYDIKIKRILIKEAFIWHTISGTASAIRKYFATISKDTDIQEWYDYNGEPYHFRIIATVPEEQEISEKDLNDIAQKISKLKNARSILDEALIVKEHIQNANQSISAGVAQIIEASFNEYKLSTCWLDNDTFLTAKNEDTIYCDKNGNVYTL